MNSEEGDESEDIQENLNQNPKRISDESEMEEDLVLKNLDGLIEEAKVRLDNFPKISKSSKKKILKDPKIKVEEDISKLDSSQEKRLPTFNEQKKEESTKSKKKFREKKSKKIILKSKTSGVSTADNRFSCQQCDGVKTYKYFHHLQRHHNDVHVMKKNFECDDCHSICASSDSLRSHKRFSHGNKKLKCNLCQKLFARKSNLDSHVRSHNRLPPVVKKEFECHLCKRVFSKKLRLDSHRCKPIKRTDPLDMSSEELASGEIQMKTDLEKPEDVITYEGQYFCNSCQIFLPNLTSFYNHNKRIHGPKNWKCQICENSYTRSDKLKAHQLSVHRVDFEKIILEDETKVDKACEEEYFSDICKKFLPNSTSITILRIKAENQNTTDQNTSIENADEKKYFCDICQKFLANSASFSKHKRCIHGPKNLKCKICEKCYSRSDKLRSHESSAHKILTKNRNLTEEEVSTEKVVEEKDLSNTFQKLLPNSTSIIKYSITAENQNSTEQKNSIDETDEEKCFCNFCQKFLPNARSFYKHNKFVHGPKTFKCEKCQKCFARSDKLRSHQLTAHKVSTETQNLSEEVSNHDEAENNIKSESQMDSTSAMVYLKIEMAQS